MLIGLLVSSNAKLVNKRIFMIEAKVRLVHNHKRQLHNFLKLKKCSKLLKLKQERDAIQNAAHTSSSNAAANDSHKVACIPPDLHLLLEQRKVLSKDLKSVPLTSNINKYELIKDMESLLQKTKIEISFF